VCEGVPPVFWRETALSRSTTGVAAAKPTARAKKETMVEKRMMRIKACRANFGE